MFDRPEAPWLYILTDTGTLVSSPPPSFEAAQCLQKHRWRVRLGEKCLMLGTGSAPRSEELDRPLLARYPLLVGEVERDPFPVDGPYGLPIFIEAHGAGIGTGIVGRMVEKMLDGNVVDDPFDLAGI